MVATAGPPEAFISDILTFAEEAVDRLAVDHAHVGTDHARRAFKQVGKIYRLDASKRPN